MDQPLGREARSLIPDLPFRSIQPMRSWARSERSARLRRSRAGLGWPYSEDAATLGSRYQVEAKRADRDGEHSSEAGAEHPTEHVCRHFKHRGRIGGRLQRAILFMVKREFSSCGPAGGVRAVIG